MANMTPNSREHILDPTSTDALALHIGSKSVDILSKSGKLHLCNFTIVIKEWEIIIFFYHYVPSEYSYTLSYARLCFKSACHALSNVERRFKPTAQSSITYLTSPIIDNHAPLSRNVTRNQLLGFYMGSHTGKQSTKLLSTQLPTKETHCHLPSCHHTSQDVHLPMLVHQRQVCSFCQCSNQHKDFYPTHQNEGANNATMTIKYGMQLEKATAATLWSQAPMHRVTQASIDTTT